MKKKVMKSKMEKKISDCIIGNKFTHTINNRSTMNNWLSQWLMHQMISHFIFKALEAQGNLINKIRSTATETTDQSDKLK